MLKLKTTFDVKVVDHQGLCAVVSLGKTLHVYLPSGLSSLPVVVAQPDERLEKEPNKKVFCHSVVRHTLSAWFTRTKGIND